MYLTKNPQSILSPAPRSEEILPGRRIKLLRINDPYVLLPAGSCGTVRRVDDAGTVHVEWDSGDSIGLCADAGDRWVLLP